MTSSVLPVMVRSDEGMSAKPGIELPFELEEEVREDEQLGSIEEDTPTIQQSPPRLVPPTSPANKLKPSSRPSHHTHKHADSSASEVMSRESAALIPMRVIVPQVPPIRRRWRCPPSAGSSSSTSL